jgi:hypothetical protein
MDSYDVRKATNFLVLVCTGYVGLYRGKGLPTLVFSLFELFFPSSSFRDSRFPLLPPATHAREERERGRGVISFLSPGLSFLRLFPSALLPFHLFGICFPDRPFFLSTNVGDRLFSLRRVFGIRISVHGDFVARPYFVRK